MHGEDETWRTFLRNHLGVSAGCDFFTVPTLAFNLLYVFVVLSHDRRRILHVNLTEHPTAEWTAQQLTEAFPGDERIPRYLHRDRDAIYGDMVRQRIAAIGMKEVISAKQSPWQNPYAERVIGSIRRECTDHLVPLNEQHLRKILAEYVAYYNRSRCHQSLEGDAPEPRQVEDGDGTVYAIPTSAGYTASTDAPVEARSLESMCSTAVGVCLRRGTSHDSSATTLDAPLSTACAIHETRPHNPRSRLGWVFGRDGPESSHWSRTSFRGAGHSLKAPFPAAPTPLRCRLWETLQGDSIP